MQRPFMEVYDELSRMSSWDIARMLHRKHIKGIPGDPTHCPVANYLRRECGLTNPTVASHMVPYRNLNDTYNGPVTPPSVQRFIEAYDGGEFPELDETWGGFGE